MPDYFNTGFFVEKSAWHNMGILLDAPPATREEAVVLAGHDYEIVAVPNGNLERQPLTEAEFTAMKFDKAQDIARVGGVWFGYKPNPDKKGLEIQQLRDGLPGPLHGNQIEVVNQSLAIIPNEIAYDLADAMLDLGFIRWAGITLRDGAECALTFKLNEPIQVSGDPSLTLPFFVLHWAHDGSGALRGRSTSIRAECWNTVSSGEAQGKRLGTEFSIKHTENWRDRVEDAKKALKGARASIEAYREVMEEFAAVEVSKADRDLFVQALVLDQTVPSVSRYKAGVAGGAYSRRVQSNVEKAVTQVNGLFAGNTIPEDHKFTAYGLHLAGVEYLDHVRKAVNDASHVGRTLLRDEPAKARLTPLIRTIAKAAA
jgi:phage/plasmid-like protein (TIGR03299 family)